MTKGDAEKCRLVAEEISAQFWEANKQYFNTADHYKIAVFATENILADILVWQRGNHKMSIALSILSGAANKSLERKREKKMDKYYSDLMMKGN